MTAAAKQPAEISAAIPPTTAWAKARASCPALLSASLMMGARAVAAGASVAAG